MPLITWQLWLARPIAMDKPLPWQKKQTHLTPGRVCQAMDDIFAQIGTPTQLPNHVERLQAGRKGPKHTETL
jgi:hypothetical protein